MADKQHIDNLSRTSRRVSRARVYRRRRWGAVLTILLGLLIGIGIQTGSLFQMLGIGVEGDAASDGVRSSSVTPTASRQTDPAPGGDTVGPVEETDGPEGTGGTGGTGGAEETDGPVETTSEDGDQAVKSPGKSGAKAQTKKPPQASEEPLNVLVLGVDRRPTETSDMGRSDTIMIVQVTPKSGRVEMLSVPRDLYVEIEPGVQDRINEAYTYGGVQQTWAVMEGVTGIPIDNYAIVDFQGFEDVIDAIGKVRVDVGQDQFPENWEMGEGMSKLNGHKALRYARYRGTPGGDLDRIRRQQKLLAALRRQALQWNTVTKVPQIVKVANENVDTDLGLLNAISIARALVLNGGANEVERVQLKGKPEVLPDGAQVLIPNDRANAQILQQFRE